MVAIFLPKPTVESAGLDELTDFPVPGLADEAFLQVESHDIEEFKDGVYGISFLFQQFGSALLAVDE